MPTEPYFLQVASCFIICASPRTKHLFKVRYDGRSRHHFYKRMLSYIFKICVKNVLAAWRCTAAPVDVPHAVGCRWCRKRRSKASQWNLCFVRPAARLLNRLQDPFITEIGVRGLLVGVDNSSAQRPIYQEVAGRHRNLHLVMVCVHVQVTTSNRQQRWPLRR